MRNAFTVLVLSVMLVLGVSAAYAQAPLDGTYKTQDNDFLEGRYSIAWPGGNTYQDANNLLHAESWDSNNGALGSQWKIVCPYIVSVQMLYHVVPNPADPTSYVEGWLVTYAGGTVWLDGSGPWGGGDPSYTGNITSCVSTRGLTVTSGNVVALDMNQSMSADIVGYASDCVTFGIGNTAWLGDTAQQGPKPADFPAFLDSNCDPNGTAGHWGTATDLTITVQGCEVGTEETSWGAVKSLYH